MINHLNNQNLFKSQGYINAKWQDAFSKETFVVYNPANAELIGQVTNMGQEETQMAIEQAQIAFVNWSQVPAKQRSEMLFKWYQLMIENQKDLATIIVIEQGKPLVEAMGEVLYAASFIQWFAEQGKRIYGHIMSDYAPSSQLQFTKEPIGVVGIITPWNFPLAMITRKVAPALASGCTVVIKPSELTPYSALAITELAEKVGIPKGVINVITTDKAKEVGQVMTQSEIVKKISFTGSTQVGKWLLAQSADTVKKMSLELGGNAPFIVFDDADIQVAIDGLIASKFRNTGQTCVCANRIYVQSAIHNQFVDQLKNSVEKFIVADGFTPKVNQGPLINNQAVEKVKNHIAISTQNSAQIIIGGKNHSKGGTFFEPTILTNVSKENVFESEETFGPVAPIIEFDTEEEAIALANRTKSGLAAYFFTQNYKRINRVNRQLQAGIIGVNTGIISNEFGPFGGIKESGLGREGSILGIDEYLETKYSLIC